MKRSSMRRTLGAGLLLLLLCAALSASCSRRQPGAIGLSLPITGPFKEWGEDLRAGIQLALDQQPDPQRLIVTVDNGSTVRGVTASLEHLVKQGATVIIGPLTTDNAQAAGVVSHALGVPCVVPGATGPELGAAGDSLLRLCYSDAEAGRALAVWARQSADLQRLAVVIDLSSSYSLGLAQAFTQEFHRQRGRIVGEVYYRAGAEDRQSVLDQVAALDVQGALVAGYAGDIEVMVRQSRSPRLAELVLLGGDGWEGAGLRTALAGRVAGAYHTRHFQPDADDPRVQSFVAAYQAAHLAAPSDLAALGYDAANFVLRSFDPQASAQQLLLALRTAGEFQGVTGRIALDAQGSAHDKDVILVQLHDPAAPAFVTRLDQ